MSETNFPIDGMISPQLAKLVDEAPSAEAIGELLGIRLDPRICDLVNAAIAAAEGPDYLQLAAAGHMLALTRMTRLLPMIGLRLAGMPADTDISEVMGG